MAISRLRACLVLVTILLALYLPACSMPGINPTRPPTVKLKVGIPDSSFVSLAPFQIAEAEGFLAEQGIEVEYVKFTQTSQAIPVLAQGQLDVLAGTLSVGLLNAIAKDSPLKFVADRGTLGSPASCPNTAILARQEDLNGGKLDNLAGLRGKKFSVNRSNYGGFMLDHLLNPAGLSLEDVKTEDVPNAAQYDALVNGAVDFVVTSEPWVTVDLERGKVGIWKEAQKLIPGFQWTLVVYGPNLLTKNPDAGKRLMVAYLKAIKQYSQGKTDRNLEIIAKATEIDRKVLQTTCWPEMSVNGQVNTQSVLEFQDWAVKKGLLDKAVTVSQFWDQSFIDYANKMVTTQPPDID